MWLLQNWFYQEKIHLLWNLFGNIFFSYRNLLLFEDEEERVFILPHNVWLKPRLSYLYLKFISRFIESVVLLNKFINDFYCFYYKKSLCSMITLESIKLLNVGVGGRQKPDQTTTKKLYKIKVELTPKSSVYTRTLNYQAFF